MDWTDIASKFGIPTLFALLLLWMFWKAAVWAANNVALPVVQAHQEYLKTTAEAAKKTADSVERMQASNDQQAKALESIKGTNIQAAITLDQIKTQLPGMCKATYEGKK